MSSSVSIGCSPTVCAEGPYFVDLGDFALAGALKINTKDEFEHNFALAEGGSFDTRRYVLGGSVPLSWPRRCSPRASKECRSHPAIRSACGAGCRFRSRK